MRILVYGLNFAPELTGTGKYTGEMASWLAEQGHEVRVVTAPPYYPDWKVRTGYSSWRWRTDAGAALLIWRCPLWVPKNAGGLKRIVHLCSFAASSLPVMLRQVFWRPDVVWFVEPTLACAPVAICTAWLSGAKSWVHIQDFEVDAAFGMGLLKGAFARRAALAIERWMMRRFDRVSTISRRMLQLARRKGVDDARLVFFPNWVDISMIRHQPLSSYREELGISVDKVVALYSGNMGNKQGLEILADVARLLHDDARIQFVFCGDGTGKQDLVQRCKGLSNVTFLPLQPLARLSDLLALADMHLLPQRADAADLVMPSKLNGMLGSGRAVVATAAPETELAEVVERRARCGVVVSPENPDALLGALVELARDPSLRAQMGVRGRVYAVSEIDRGAVLRKFEQELCTVTGLLAPSAAQGQSVPQRSARPRHRAAGSSIYPSGERPCRTPEPTRTVLPPPDSESRCRF